VAAVPAEDKGARQRSLALPTLVSGLSERSLSVLDLGAANPANLEFFTHRGAQLTIADFHRSLLPLVSNASSKADLFRKLLPYDASTRFDVVLAWDLLNYLGPEEIGYLTDSLARFFRPGTMIHAFVVCDREMPPAPSLYRILGETELQCERRPGRPRPAPRYLEPTLLKLMPGIAVESRYQLRNGMLEYVFSCRTRPLLPLSKATDAVSSSRWQPVSRSSPAPSR
jgi:hypothetical protein